VVEVPVGFALVYQPSNTKLIVLSRLLASKSAFSKAHTTPNLINFPGAALPMDSDTSVRKPGMQENTPT
jgi:hypothetical protein